MPISLQKRSYNTSPLYNPYLSQLRLTPISVNNAKFKLKAYTMYRETKLQGYNVTTSLSYDASFWVISFKSDKDFKECTGVLYEAARYNDFKYEVIFFQGIKQNSIKLNKSVNEVNKIVDRFYNEVKRFQGEETFYNFI